MVCDLLERGLGLNHETLLVNIELIIYNKPKVRTSCVRETYQRPVRTIIPTQKVVIWTNNAHSPWAVASFNAFK